MNNNPQKRKREIKTFFKSDDIDKTEEKYAKKQQKEFVAK
jgi:hypothetical protein